MKHIRILFLIILACSVLLCACSKSGNDNSQNISNGNTEISTDFDKIVSQAIIEQNKDRYSEGECPAEGHIIFDTEEKSEKTILYSYVSFAWYGFENGKFIDVSGFQSPAVITFDTSSNSVDIKYPQDGAEYEVSIKRMFPKSCVKKVLNYLPFESSDLQNQQEAYALRYLGEIGRNAQVGEMQEEDYPIVDGDIDTGENALKIENYPYWIGDKELIEDGVRYVYQTEFDKKHNKVIYTKYEFDNPDNIVESFEANVNLYE